MRIEEAGGTAAAGQRRRAGRILVDGWLFLPAGIVLACYAPVFFFEYGFGEDYRLLAAAQRGGGLSTLLLAEGRPAYAIWARSVFAGLDGIASLVWVRGLNVAMLAVVATMLALAWRRAGLGRPWAALAGAATMTLPPFQLYAATAAMGGVPFGMVAAGAAALLACSRSNPAVSGRGVRWLAAFGLLTIALITYQPAGLFYLVFVAIFLISARPDAAGFRRGLISFGSIAVPAMLLAFVLFLIGRSAFPQELIEIGAPRGTLTDDPIGKIRWFLILPLPRALSFWKLWPSLTLAFVMLIVLCAGIGLYLRGTSSMPVRALLALGLVPLAYMPNLVVSENHASFRSMPALAALMFVYLLTTLRGQFAGRREWLFGTMLAGMTVFGAGAAAYTVVAYVAAPQAAELELVRSTIAALPDGTDEVVMARSTYEDTLAPLVLGDEFGYPSTALPWSRRAITWLVLREAMPAADTAAIRVTEVEPGTVAAETVIDWGDVLRTRSRQ